MERRKNNRRARGRANVRESEANEPRLNISPAAPSFLQEPLDFLRVNNILDKLGEATINRETPQHGFISQQSLLKIWKGGVLAGFLMTLGYGNNPALVDNVLMHLIKTTSILVAIRWQEWSSFGQIFFEPRRGEVLRHDRKDQNLPYSLDILEDLSFLGKSWAGDFLGKQSCFLPIIIEQGTNDVYPRTRPLPFIRSRTQEIAIGGYGSVSKEVIAKYQFLPQTDINSRDLNKVCVIVSRFKCVTIRCCIGAASLV